MATGPSLITCLWKIRPRAGPSPEPEAPCEVNSALRESPLKAIRECCFQTRRVLGGAFLSVGGGYFDTGPPLRWLGLPLGNILWYPKWIEWLFGGREMVARM